MSDRFGPNNSNWQGGRVTDPRGYILIRVGEGHHLADVRGYAYEHRMVAEQILARPLTDWDAVRHRTKNVSDNSPGNLSIKTLAIQPCACGCGTWLTNFDPYWRPRRYFSGHNMRDGSRA